MVRSLPIINLIRPLLYGLALIIWLVPEYASAQIVVVVPDKSPLDSLSFKEVQKVFKGQPIDKVEEPPQVVEYAPAGDAFYQMLYDLTAYAMGKHWLRMIFSGQRVRPPKSFTEVDRLVKYMAEHENTIGFLPRELFEHLEDSPIRAVVIDGFRYDHPQYAFKSPPEEP
ncbi:MAG: hypothetical protein D6681_06090 [Calditrichaeota bacterium]|nr:MAG: hypothetical protein D6681_06090 [Calditrichota bacterium]